MATTVKTPITREGLIEKLIEYRSEQWDHDDTVEMLEYGRTGFVEMTNEVLEEIANDDYMLQEGVYYKITDTDPSKPSAEAINKELLEALKAVQEHITGADVLFDPNPQWEGEQARYDKAQEALCLVDQAIAKAEGR